MVIINDMMKNKDINISTAVLELSIFFLLR